MYLDHRNKYNIHGAASKKTKTKRTTSRNKSNTLSTSKTSPRHTTLIFKNHIMTHGTIAACKAGELEHMLDQSLRVLGTGRELLAQLPGTDVAEGTLLASAGVA